LVVLGIGGVPTSRQSTLLGFSALAAAVAAVLYAGVRERVAVRARLVVDPMGSERDVVRMFSRRVAADLPVDELLPVLIESLGSGLRLSRTEVWLHSAGLLKLAAADPPRPRGPIVLGNVEGALTRRAGVIGRSWL